ncbi:putative glutamate receptor [Sarcoptes scabiei]|uniref:Putative glutamate receptor n=1 Tax=Sarcoptes scabiei TaxID=52283 RepID=A0A834R644_SARSC|nr:putative glutamate receptor [Sarcoptes scabiei]
MNLIAQKVGFEYRLYFSPDGKYGTEFNGNINGMIGEVFRNRADFAIADLTVTESRKRYVDFTEPFLENQLAAIIRRDDAVGLRTLEDLVTLNEINHRPDIPPTERRGLLTYGTYRTGATYYHLSKNKDPIAKKIYEWMFRNPDALVTSAKEGFDRVNVGHYAFIVESTFAEYLTGIYCNLTMLYDTRSLYPRRFGIALPKGSPYVQEFNKAIRELKSSGIIQRLRHKYWINRCEHRNLIDDIIIEQNHSNNQSPSPSSSTTPPIVSNENGDDNKNQINDQNNSESKVKKIENDEDKSEISKNNDANFDSSFDSSNNLNNNQRKTGDEDRTTEVNSNNNNNSKEHNANTMQIEWSNHNHHQQQFNHRHQQNPKQPSLVYRQQQYPHRIDQNRGIISSSPSSSSSSSSSHPHYPYHHHPHLHHRINYHQMNRPNMKSNSQQPDYDPDEMYYLRNSPRRTTYGLTSSATSTFQNIQWLSVIIITIVSMTMMSMMVMPTTSTTTTTKRIRKSQSIWSR